MLDTAPHVLDVLLRHCLSPRLVVRAVVAYERLRRYRPPHAQDTAHRHHRCRSCAAGARCRGRAGSARSLLIFEAEEATILGTDGNDRVIGTDGPDIILAGAGNDVVSDSAARPDMWR
jgi:RTX calcium-binding nonapeptide repeat (4 copies)